MRFYPNSHLFSVPFMAIILKSNVNFCRTATFLARRKESIDYRLFRPISPGGEKVSRIAEKGESNEHTQGRELTRIGFLIWFTQSNQIKSLHLFPNIFIQEYIRCTQLGFSYNSYTVDSHLQSRVLVVRAPYCTCGVLP